MNSKLSWWCSSYLMGRDFVAIVWKFSRVELFILVIFNFLLFHSTESYVLSNSTKQKNESIELTNTQSSVPTPLITKPNSYLYNPDDDDDEDNEIERIKRDATPFVCKGEIIVREY